MRTAAILVALLAAGLSGAQASPPPRGPFALGVEYMAAGMADIYARTGVTWAKAMGSGFTWGEIEPRPPVHGRHTYVWTHPDRLILEYQRAGFRHFQLYVRCLNPWASSRPIKPIGGGSWPPKPEYLPDYRAFLRALVRRYDPASPEHAPGLLYPVEHFEIEAEWGTGFWQGTLAEYLDLLRVAYPTIKAANPRASVILQGFFLAGVFEERPDPSQLPSALAALPAARRQVTRRYLDDIRALLRHPELFDIVEFHSLSDWSEIPGMARFLRQTMRECGYEKPIWVGDVNYTASPLVFWGIPVPPYTASQKPEIDRTLRALSHPGGEDHARAMAWFRREQARGLVKKAVLAMAEGLAGINLGNLTDWGILALAPGITGTAAFHGMIDTADIPPRPGRPRPAYEALSLVSRTLGAFSSVRRLPAAQGIHAYEFAVRGRRVVCVWYDDGRRYLPWDREPQTVAQIGLPNGRYSVVATPVGGGSAPVRTVVATGGRVTLDIDATPVFLEAEAVH
jgi:hypothetical protein